jgi:hypothetical protein
MIATPDDIRKVRPVAENISDLKRIEPYINESERLLVLPIITASLYRQFDELDLSGPGPYSFTTQDGAVVTLTKAQVLIILDGGYYTGGCGNTDKYTQGLTTAIAYLAYHRFLPNHPLNATAFGVVTKNGEFSEPAEEKALVRASNEAKNIGYAILNEVVDCMTSFGLLGSCRTKAAQPVRFVKVGRKLL